MDVAAAAVVAAAATSPGRAEVVGVLAGKVALGFHGRKSRNKWAIIDRREQRVQNRREAAVDAAGRQAFHRFGGGR